MRILCEALNTGCAETLLQGCYALQEEVDPRGARQRRGLKPCSPDARTSCFVLPVRPDDPQEEQAVEAPEAVVDEPSREEKCSETRGVKNA